MDNDFKKARETYNNLRNIERQKIVNKLKKENFIAKGRQGTWNYTSQGKIKRSYNLGLWKWIVATKGDITAVISLQTIEQDSKTKNIHVLFDRISIDVFKDNEKNVLSENSDSYFSSIKPRYNVENEFDSAFFEKAITDLELPLEDADLDSLLAIIEKKIDELN